MSAGYVGILSVELHFPENGSLKGKRKDLLSAKAQLQRRFGASVAEVDHHELWQRTALAVAVAAGDWYCLAWLWPLVQHAYATSCVRAGTFPFMESAIPPSSGQFPLYIGLAPDAVASIEVYFPGGATEQVPIVDNVFAFQAWRAQPAKLVAYDAEGNPVWVTPVA